MEKQILLTWLGKHDLDAESQDQRGAIASILMDSPLPFDEVHILVQNWHDQIKQYQHWLKSVLKTQNRSTRICMKPVELANPIDYEAIYRIGRDELNGLSAKGTRVTLNITSGTPAMTAIWVLLGKGVYGCSLTQTSRQNGTEPVNLPFDISLEYLQQQDSRLTDIVSEPPSSQGDFSHIQACSAQMRECISMAIRVSQRTIPVLIQGETGTGKEVVASAIHRASMRCDQNFIAVNCGAIPESLLDSHLFGHKKGAFTGADANHKGYFEEASGGTLFLDEVGELPLDAQAKLLRALQQQEIMRVGDSKPIKVDVRVITATHRNLLAMVDEGSFREDLFYRLAVGIIQLPPLRERAEDIEPLVNDLLNELNTEARTQPGYIGKKISRDGMEFIKSQHWPGNIRELWNTLVRASIWSDGELLEAEHLQRAMIERTRKQPNGLCEFDVSTGIDINEFIDKTKRSAIEQALKATAGQKVKAAKLLGLGNHQTLSNWMKQLGMVE